MAKRSFSVKDVLTEMFHDEDCFDDEPMMNGSDDEIDDDSDDVTNEDSTCTDDSSSDQLPPISGTNHPTSLISPDNVVTAFPSQPTALNQLSSLCMRPTHILPPISPSMSHRSPTASLRLSAAALQSPTTPLESQTSAISSTSFMMSNQTTSQSQIIEFPSPELAMTHRTDIIRGRTDNIAPQPNAEYQNGLLPQSH
jgi:hypothetical protein